jgi:hypothetical protein
MSPPPPAKVEPLTADLRRLHLTVSKRFLEKLEAARDALSHSHPGADAEAILEAGRDHVRPVALGGESTADNLRLACSAHNLLAARRIFGDALMDRYAPARPSGAPGEMR